MMNFNFSFIKKNYNNNNIKRSMNIHITKVFSLSVVGRSNGASMKYIYIYIYIYVYAFFLTYHPSSNTNMKAFHLSISSFGSFTAHLIGYFKHTFEYFKHTHFFIHMYIKNTQTTLLKLFYPTISQPSSY